MSNLPQPTAVALTSAQCTERAQQNAPALRRRLAAFVYEGVLLFGLFMAVGFAYSVTVQQKHGLQGRQGMMAVQFLALALYFIWFWTHGGQTLAMKTWHLRLVSKAGGAISLKTALLRFMASWLWFMPAWLGAWLAGWHQSKLLYGAMFVWAGMYAALTWLLPKRQLLHDVMCGTCVIDNRG
jgi:uncharacterized RDD family membrane protein YckC